MMAFFSLKRQECAMLDFAGLAFINIFFRIYLMVLQKVPIYKREELTWESLM